MGAPDRIAVCLVTNEMYPFLPGGIGRLMYNFATRNRDSDTPVDFHFLLPAPEEDGMAEAIRDEYAGKATVHFAPTLEDLRDPVARALRAGSARNFDHGVHYRLAWLLHHGLMRATHALGRDFDIVEWPDFGGWSNAALAAKRAGMAYGGSAFAYRLHSAHGLITAAERHAHAPSPWYATLMDMEREGLAHADIVVGHIPAIVQANADHYRLGEPWAKGAVVEFPPITVEGAPDVPDPEGDPDFIFSSRLQPFKRPDIFVKAAVAFCDRHPDYAGVFRLVSYGWDQDYIGWLKGLVPAALKGRVVFVEKASAAERMGYLARSIVVVPSDYESLCLFAYEAGQMGRRVILNRACAAFGQFDRWRDGDNCLMFDGDFLSLAEVMEKALDWQPAGMVSAAPDRPYWEDRRHLPEVAPGADPGPAPPVLAYGFTGLADLNRAWTTRVPGADTHFLIPAHAFDGARAAARDLESAGAKVHLMTGAQVNPAELQRLVKTLGAAHVILAPADARLHPDFLPTARKALSASPDLAAFGGHARVLSPADGSEIGLRLGAGEAQSLAMVENAVCPGPVMVAATAVARIGFDEMARGFWRQAFLRRLVLSGAPVVVAPAVLSDVIAARAAEPNAPAFSASIADETARAAGLVPRLMVYDPPLEGHGPAGRTTVLEGKALSALTPVQPLAELEGWHLVAHRPDLGGALVRPRAQGPVVAELTAAVEGHPTQVLWEVENASDLNNGVEVCVVASFPALGPAEFAAIDTHTPWIDGVSALAWHGLEPGQRATFATSLLGVPARHIYLLTRAPAGLSHKGAMPVFRRLEFLY